MNEQKNNRVKKAIDKLHDSVLTIVLSTLNSNGEPETSYSPYAFDGENYFVLTSDLAPHSQNMKQNSKISFILIEDETNAKYLYDRTRLSYHAETQIVNKESEEFKQVIDILKDRAGKMVDLLVTFPDFNLFKITPSHGRLILGFGEAYLIDNQTKTITHVDKDYVAQSKA